MQKKFTLTLTAILLYTLSFSQTSDSSSIGAGYTNQTFYSMANGTVSSVLHTDWDLAFQVAGFEAAILINSKNNVHLFRSGKDISQWNSLTANDTVGYLNSYYELLNSDTSWWYGAFNLTNDSANAFDLGWGVYDFATHYVVGDSLYYIQLASGAIKKLWIVDLSNSNYNFKYADMDGNNEVTTMVSKGNYINKNFGYYSIENGTALDREPLKTDWDIVFNQYMAINPLTYKVTGVLTNAGASAIKMYPVNDVNATTTDGQNYPTVINTIGYDWKAYDFNTNSYIISDSTVYFVKDIAGSYWKLVFTGFGGPATGIFYFNKEQVTPTGVNELNQSAISLMEIYPNPATENIRLLYDVKNASKKILVQLQNNVGQAVYTYNLSIVNGLNQLTIPCMNLSKGLYFLTMKVDGKQEVRKVIVY